LAIATRCLEAQKKPLEERQTYDPENLSRTKERKNRARAKYIAAANRGWMSEKYLPPADQVKCFFLTSPFIEPALVKKSTWPIEGKARG
jgi:hypothetical protein